MVFILECVYDHTEFIYNYKYSFAVRYDWEGGVNILQKPDLDSKFKTKKKINQGQFVACTSMVTAKYPKFFFSCMNIIDKHS